MAAGVAGASPEGLEFISPTALSWAFRSHKQPQEEDEIITLSFTSHSSKSP